MGKTLDVILHRGSIRKGDEIVVATSEGGISTRVKGLFSPRGMSEMRDAGDRWDDTDIAHAASGLKISAPDLDNVLAGTTLRVVNSEEERGGNLSGNIRVRAVDRAGREEGCIKADTVGGLEALAKELQAVDVPIRSASIGKVSRRDVRSAEAASDPLHRIIMAFSTDILPDARARWPSPTRGSTT